MNIIILKLFLIEIPTFSDIFSFVWKIILFLGFIYFIYLFARIHKNEKKLLSLYKKRDDEIEKIKSQPNSQSFQDRSKRKIELEYQKEISKLETKRKWDLEKIPFLKK